MSDISIMHYVQKHLCSVIRVPTCDEFVLSLSYIYHKTDFIIYI